MSGDKDKSLAMLCHLLGIFTSFLGALIIWLMKKAESPTIDANGKEALNFQITVAIAYVASGFLAVIGIGILLAFAIGIANLIFCIMASVKVSSGAEYNYPVCIRLIK